MDNTRQNFFGEFTSSAGSATLFQRQFMHQIRLFGRISDLFIGFQDRLDTQRSQHEAPRHHRSASVVTNVRHSATSIINKKSTGKGRFFTLFAPTKTFAGPTQPRNRSAHTTSPAVPPRGTKRYAFSASRFKSASFFSHFHFITFIP
jgi:hypothetical protein